MGIRDRLRTQAAPFLDPAEPIEAVFLARRPELQYNDRAVVATPQRLLLLELNRLGRPRAVLAARARATRLGPCQGLMHQVTVFGTDLLVGRRFFKDVTEADRLAGWSAEREDGSVLVVASRGWKAAALPLVVGGWVMALLLAEAILLIDGAITAVHYTPSQDAVGVTAMVVGFGTAIFVVVVAVRWWRRPAVTISNCAVTMYRRRPLAVPWPMIAEVTSGTQAGSSVHRAPGVLLAEGDSSGWLRSAASRSPSAGPVGSISGRAARAQTCARGLAPDVSGGAYWVRSPAHRWS